MTMNAAIGGLAHRDAPVAASGGSLGFLASPEVLVLGYIASVLFSFKIALFIVFALALLGMRWKFTVTRVAVFLLLAASVLLFFATAEKLASTLTALLVFLGLFQPPAVRQAKTAAHRATTALSIGLVALTYYSSIAFVPADGVVSHNFIPIICLYILLAAMPLSRSRVALMMGVFAAMTLTAGSRSGAAVFVLLGLYLFSPRLALVSIAVAVPILLLGPSTEVLPDQFQRNYQDGIEPRLFIWVEFVNAAVAGDLFRRETFDFMDTFDLQRNFHNSLLEAYYRLGPTMALLLLCHFRLLWRVRHERVAFAVFLMLLLKALTDTFLWFTAVDLILFQAYGRRIFGRPARSRNQ